MVDQAGQAQMIGVSSEPDFGQCSVKFIKHEFISYSKLAVPTLECVWGRLGDLRQSNCEVMAGRRKRLHVRWRSYRATPCASGAIALEPRAALIGGMANTTTHFGQHIGDEVTMAE